MVGDCVVVGAAVEIPPETELQSNTVHVGPLPERYPLGAAREVSDERA